jgi:hypothetical protein
MREREREGKRRQLMGLEPFYKGNFIYIIRNKYVQERIPQIPFWSG